MTVIRESPWYQEATAKGNEIGKREQALKMVLRLLAHRFGKAALEMEQRLSALPVDQLEALTELLLDVHGLEEVTAWLDTVLVSA